MAQRTPGAYEDRAAETRRTGRSALVTGLLLGVGIAGFIDETVFHQLLQWHNLYWATDQHGRILSDGIFHTVSTLLLLAGTLRLWLDRAAASRRVTVIGAILIGLGGFNAYDGVVQHVMLHLHLVNEHVCAVPRSPDNSILNCRADIPYEVAWIGVALLILLAGLVLSRRAATGAIQR